ncbi:MAG: UDP-N-acetylmuramoyl-tripeptide--D-alanyl-D-alanine ligase [Prevotellaceae bacterium]|jgi:UDP-N-acetylmuramoyl-tripeptide--D-alanyl-D-alanine ligase|nr:UDP-N-acetylmuramoyl-tripeptide--D-alanyl-D-alanine ligase [Prevotellaceae bacterium]
MKLYKLFVQHPAVCTDSREVKKNSIFFALKGERFDGNRFALQALEQGAAYAVVDDPALPPHPQLIPTDNALKALQDMAREHRQKLKIPLIAITGTNGKTTTKELAAQVLSAKFNVSVTRGNLNNHIGVPLTLLRMQAGTQIGIVEMGASHPGEIAQLCRIALPDYGLITNVGKAHLEGFGSIEGVRKAKGELYAYLAETGGAVFYNAGNPALCDMMKNYQFRQQFPYGAAENRATILPAGDTHPCLRLAVKGFSEISTHLVGDYNADNVLAALSIGAAFGVPPHAAAAAINNYIPSNNRSQLLQTAQYTVIVDAYNANPSSMAAAINNFAQLHHPHKCVILGDMLELGADTAAEHAHILFLLKQKSFSTVFLVGERFMQANAKHTFLSFANVEALAEHLHHHPLVPQTAVLLKASHGLRLDTLLPCFTELRTKS